MRDVKFRYYLNRFKDGKRQHIVLTLDGMHGMQSIGANISNELGIVARCQYIGLLDKNDVEVYEGDIVTLSDMRHKVQWNPELCGFGIQPLIKNVTWAESILGIDDGKHRGLEVIGNVYENSELLK